MESYKQWHAPMNSAAFYCAVLFPFLVYGRYKSTLGWLGTEGRGYCRSEWINIARETIEWWPLLNVETEVNGDSKSSKERGPFLVVLSGLSCRYRYFCSALAALVGPVQNI